MKSSLSQNKWLCGGLGSLIAACFVGCGDPLEYVDVEANEKEYVNQVRQDSIQAYQIACRNVYVNDVTYFTDARDGQVYGAITIGTQTWMAQNLNYSIDESYCYDNDDNNCLVYGRLYTWYAAMEACPEGWHLPSKEEWDTLFDAVGNSGQMLKSVSGWAGNGNNGFCPFGFSVLPAGYYYYGSDFYGAGRNGLYWSSTEDSSYSAYFKSFYYDDAGVYESYDYKGNGFSVRCLRNSN